MVEFLGPLVGRIAPEPHRLDHAPALWRGHLPVLAGEIIFAERAANLLDHLLWLALRMQGLAGLAAEGLPSEHGLDPVQFLLVGNRREAHDLPRFLRQHVTGEVILMQPVHDQHDGTRQLVVEPAVEGVVVPFVGRPALRLRQRLLRL
jgi:hypothetical protein